MRSMLLLPTLTAGSDPGPLASESERAFDALTPCRTAMAWLVANVQ
jgi:hypothetical protein